MSNLSLGKQGELIACKYLQKNGYKILTQNFRCQAGEIDIIALDNQTLVFIEVKTRQTLEYGLPQEAISFWKIKSLTKTANFFKMLHPELPDSLRIDVVGILLNSAGVVKKIELIKNAIG